MFKKNQIMITALALMIAVAGYLQFAGGRLQDEVAEGEGTASEVLADYSGEDMESTSENTDEVDALLDISEEDIEQAELEEIESLDFDELALQGSYEEEVPGEAVFTTTTTINTLAGAKLMKEQTRAQNREILQGIIDNETLTSEEKSAAVVSMVEMTDISEKEMSAETMLEAKGFENIVVSIGDNMVDVMVDAASLDDTQRAQIEDVVSRKTGIAIENILITPISVE